MASDQQAVSSNLEQCFEILKQKKLQVKFYLEGTAYEPLENIGTGAYGVVCSAVDKRNQRKVAIKKIPNAFAAQTVTKRTLREVKILRHFDHPNVIAVLDMLRADEECSALSNDVYIVFDLMETDLHHVIHSKQPLTERHVQFFLYQILRGLRYIHSANIIHRDLKPSNLMVNGDCSLKIGDFGMARSLVSKQNSQHMCNDTWMTQYVATRWYRAPELLFSIVDYSFGVDIWSVGCILAEMLNRRQLFPGRDHISQMKLIVYYLGAPSSDMMNAIHSELIKKIIIGFGRKAPLPWQAIVPKAEKNAVDLLSKLLRLAPWERCSADEALRHCYFDEFRNSDDYQTCTPFSLSVDVENLSPEKLKEAMFEEVADFQTTTASGRGLFNADRDHSMNVEDQAIQIENTLLTEIDCAHGSSAHDIEMLSAKLEQSSLKQLTGETEMNPVKAALLRKLMARQEHKESVEKKVLSKKEKKRRKSQGTIEKHETPGLSDLDQNLLDHWNQLQQKSKTQQAAANDVTSCDSAEDRKNMQSELQRIILNAFPSMDSAKSEITPNSAQLMEDWIIATDVNPEVLKEIEKDVAMKFS